jgi:hypothetical protein
VEVLERQLHLANVVGTSHSTRGFAGGLNCWKQETHQDANNGDDDQEFHQREGGPRSIRFALHRRPQKMIWREVIPANERMKTESCIHPANLFQEISEFQKG